MIGLIEGFSGWIQNHQKIFYSFNSQTNCCWFKKAFCSDPENHFTSESWFRYALWV